MINWLQGGRRDDNRGNGREIYGGIGSTDDKHRETIRDGE